MTKHLPTLHSLCLVNREFNSIFSPLLYRHVYLGWDREPWSQHCRSIPTLPDRHLDHVKAITGHGLLDIHGRDELAQQTGYPINDALIKVLAKTTRLESFSFFDGHITLACVEALSKVATLQSLILHFTHSYHEDIGLEGLGGEYTPLPWDVHGQYFGPLSPALASFTGLKRLELLDVWGGMLPWKDALPKMLAQNRTLEHFCISMSRDTWDWEAWANDRRPRYLWSEIWDDLAHEMPLKLKTLHLGLGVTSPSLQQFRNFTDPAVLEDLAVFNCGENRYFPRGVLVPLNIISPEVTTSLKMLTCAGLDDDLWERLDGISPYHRRLALRFLDSGPEQYNVLSIFQDHPNLNLTRLIVPCIDTWPPSGLESFTGGRQLEQLALPCTYFIGREIDGEEFSIIIRHMLDTLINLTAVWLNYGITPSNPDPVPDSWTVLANRVALAGRSLSYVRVGDIAWRVQRSKDGLRLIRLDEDENRRQCPELFRVRRFDTLSIMSRSSILEY